MVNRKRKNVSGAVTNYLPRNKVLKKLQLRLSDFRRICIWKGIYPQEPKHPKKVGLGSSQAKTYYFAKDVQFLQHEPLLAKFREFKIFVRKLKKATAKKEPGAAARLRRNKPKYNLDHVVKERYPSFIDALRDNDDCLSMCSLFATLPKTRKTHVEQIDLCQRLVSEFMHYVMATNSLRKVFISIKGFYYQVEVEGQILTWIVPHKLAYDHPVDVDYRIMSSFVEFYTILLGHINFKLFSKLGIVYPPTITSINQKLVLNVGDEPGVQPDVFLPVESGDGSLEEKRQKEQEAVRTLQSLFVGLKFFLGREVPREAVTFVIRSIGGQVSWDRTIDAGATYDESDTTITHQIVDRPQVENKYISRYYVQPQWVFDCVNTRKLLPVNEYFPGEILPPHLSPFVEEGEGDYMPPEKRRQLGLEPLESTVNDDGDEEVVEEEEEMSMAADDDGDDSVDQEESEKESEKSEDDEVTEKPAKKAKLEKSAKKTEVEQPTKKTKAKLITKATEAEEPAKKIRSGTVQKVDAGKAKKKGKDEETKLSEMMVAKKHRRLFNKIKHLNKKKAQEAQVLTDKREAIDKTKRRKINKD